MNCEKNGSSPLFVVGAGRSGTNFISHALGSCPGMYNAFENRYIWNYRQSTLAHDVRGMVDATPRVTAYIRSFYSGLHDKTGSQVIDKTPSNVFRLPFVRAIFPSSKIIHVIRDGRDNVLSRTVEWGASQSDNSAGFDSAFLKRLRHFRTIYARGNLPISRVPVFIRDNISHALPTIFGARLSRYGERFPGMDSCVSVYGVECTAAIQWREAVMSALSYGRSLPASDYMEVRYEEIISDPLDVWEQIAGFAQLSRGGKEGEVWIKGNMRSSSSGRWKSEMTAQRLAMLEPHIRPTLEFLGYDWV